MQSKRSGERALFDTTETIAGHAAVATVDRNGLTGRIQLTVKASTVADAAFHPVTTALKALPGLDHHHTEALAGEVLGQHVPHHDRTPHAPSVCLGIQPREQAGRQP